MHRTHYWLLLTSLLAAVPATAQTPPAPAAPSNANFPVENTVLQHLLNAPPPGGLRVADGVLIAGDFSTQRAYPVDLPTALTPTNANAARTFYPSGPLAAGPLLVGHSFDLREFVAMEPRTQTIRWRTPLNFPATPTGPRVEGAFFSDGLVIVRFASMRETSWRGALLAFDATTGAIRWREESPESYTAVTVAHGRVYTAIYRGEIAARNASTGAMLWHQRPTGASVAASDVLAPAGNDGLLWSGVGPGMRLLNGATGAAVRTYTLPGNVHFLVPATTATNIFATVRLPSFQDQADYDYVVVNVDINTGAIVWRTDPYRDREQVPASTPIVVGDAVYTCTQESVLRGYELATGRQRWHYGMHECQDLMALPSAGGPPRFAVRASDGRIAVFSRAATPMPVESITVRGRARDVVNHALRNESVLVYGTRVTSDARGQFVAQLEARGELVSRLAVGGESVRTALTGARTYNVTVRQQEMGE